MSATYYDRTPDALGFFATEEDRKNEREVADQLEKVWFCALRSFGCVAPIDWYAFRDRRLLALIELKSRSHPSTKYPTVFLNVRKWLALSLASAGLGVPAIFVVRFTDGIWWVPLRKVNATDVRIGGCSREVKSETDIEPVIEVRIVDMIHLGKGEGR